MTYVAAAKMSVMIHPEMGNQTGEKEGVSVLLVEFLLNLPVSVIKV